MADQTARDVNKAEDKAGLLPSEGVELKTPARAPVARPPIVTHVSLPAYQSPLRHHSRTDSAPRRPVKETRNARSEYSNSEEDGTAEHRINQYVIKQEIGRGSFGAVHLAVDQFGEEYAVKEFSKSRLRKRAQSNLLRRPQAGRGMGQFTAGKSFNSPLHRRDTSQADHEDDALNLIKEELAIMKKLHHPNLVSLIEVLDDPEEDSLYMVMEVCKNGIVMKVGLEEIADPYNDEQCRHWFRDMILGIEYLHAQGIIHRDIKPDNCLITEEGILKVSDFGVSEMFDKDSEMSTKKSAGSPAFMAPELCTAVHEPISGRAADIWSMGITLFCLAFGRIPFEKGNMLDLYDAIREDRLDIPDCDENLRGLLTGLLDKDASTRLVMEQVRAHPWVTRDGADPLLPREENVANIIEPPTQEELNAAITGNMGGLVTVVKAVKKFKGLLYRRQPNLIEGIFGRASHVVAPPGQMRNEPIQRPQSVQLDVRRPIESALVTEGVHREIVVGDDLECQIKPLSRVQTATGTANGPHQPETLEWTNDLKRNASHSDSPFTSPTPQDETPSVFKDTGKGHAHNPLEDSLFLNIGNGGRDDTEELSMVEDDGSHLVSESPSNTELDVYEKAYQDEVEKIMAARHKRPTLYLTRRVEGNKTIRDDERITDHARGAGPPGILGFQNMVAKARGHALSSEPNKDAQENDKR